jgi:hypothetical protein
MNQYQKLLLGVLYVIIIYIYIKTYLYLDQLNNCDCFNKSNKYASNLEFMKFFQILEIFILSIIVGLNLVVHKQTKKTIVNKLLLSISFILLIGISGYMAYNVINLYTNIKDDCKCSDSIYKYFVYFEGLSSISVIMRVLSIILTFGVLFLFAKLK